MCPFWSLVHRGTKRLAMTTDGRWILTSSQTFCKLSQALCSVPQTPWGLALENKGWKDPNFLTQHSLTEKKKILRAVTRKKMCADVNYVLCSKTNCIFARNTTHSLDLYLNLAYWFAVLRVILKTQSVCNVRYYIRDWHNNQRLQRVI